MESIFRATSVYFVLLVLFRVTGRRALSQATNFDFVLLLIIGEAIQNGLLGNDFSLVNAGLTVVTLLFLDVVISVLKQYLPVVERVVEGSPFIVVDHGKLLSDRMNRSRVDANDIMEAAREKMGLERMEQIKFAVLEKSGEISIVPMENAR